MEMATNRKSWGEGRPLSEAASGATEDVSPEAQWLAESLSGSKGLISGRGQRGITLSYAYPGWGGDILCQ